MASIADGYTLFVPVDTAISGTSGQPIATSRHVPSPPSTTTAPTCSFHIRVAAAMVSSTRAGDRLVQDVHRQVQPIDGTAGQVMRIGGQQHAVGAGLDGGDHRASNDADLGAVGGVAGRRDQPADVLARDGLTMTPTVLIGPPGIGQLPTNGRAITWRMPAAMLAASGT